VDINPLAQAGLENLTNILQLKYLATRFHPFLPVS
jgi:hypothetical protein